MRSTIGNFIIEIVGAFVVWSLKGFKGSISDEMSGPNELNSKTWRNFFITLIIVVLGVGIIKKTNKTENKSEKYKIEIIYAK